MENKKGIRNISILGALGLSIGTAIGWGSFVVTGTSFVSRAGPLGSTIGLLIGFVIMCVVAYCYHYMMNKYPDTNGGIYSFLKHTFGRDHAFLASWFLIITYSAILWANVSSFSVFAHCIFGDAFHFGFHYSIGGYEVWLGEVLLSLFFLCLFGGICLLSKRVVTSIQFGFVAIFFAIIIGGFIVAVISHQGGIETYKPHFAPTNENEFIQIMRVVSMTPWAFIGFENISHSARNFKFNKKHIFKVFLISLIVSTIIYILLCQLCISVFPGEYTGWPQYLSSLPSPNELKKLEDVPAFYVINQYIGTFGIVLFSIALFMILATSIIGNVFGLSGLLSALSRDGVFPEKLAKENKHENPTYIIIIVLGITAFMLFFGKVLIGWIVDVNNICGTIIYSYIAAVTIYQSKKDKNKTARVMGIIGLVIGIAFAISILIGSLMSVDWIEPESILIFFIWAVVGFVIYAIILGRDKKKRFGHSLAPVFGMYSIIICAIASWLAQVVKIYNDPVKTTWGIIACAFVAITTQIIFFFVFGVVRKRERDMQRQLVFGMATMVEGRDNNTGGHIRRTSEVVKILCEEIMKDNSFGLHHYFFVDLIKAAPMHDLGKITVEDAILRKPGKYTPEEYDVMKSHSEEGYKIVKNILHDCGDEYFEEIATNVAHYHHERWDGNGYPKGLKGEEIPLEARIMAIADVYDALVSKRVYKDEFSFEKANEIILDGMGKQFDPNLEKYYLRAREKIEQFYIDNK